MNKEQIIKDATIGSGEKLTDAFIRNYCNDHQGLRWLRGAFYDEPEKLETIIAWLEYADKLISAMEKEII